MRLKGPTARPPLIGGNSRNRLPDYAPPAFSSSLDAEAAARSGVLAPTRCKRPASPFIMSYESEQIRLGSLLQEVLGEDGLYMSSGSEAGSDSESADPLPDELHNSESEEELSDRESSGNNNAFYLGKDNSTKWSKEPPRQSVRTRRFNLVTQLPGPKRVTSSEKEPLGIWRHFFDDTIIEIIVKYTNQSIANVKDNFSRETYAKQTDYNEICCLIGLLLLAGVQKSNHLNIEKLFRTDGGSVEIFRLSMSAQRFKFLLRTLRFDDCTTREQRKALDKICHIREIFEKFVQNCKNGYTLSAYVTVDEKLEAFRGRCSFRQYIPNKPNPYGIKVQALCDAKMFYTFNMEIYPGKQPNEGPYNLDNSGLAVVQRLCEPIFNTGRNVTTDNWYSSIPLAEVLLQKGFRAEVGKAELLQFRHVRPSIRSYAIGILLIKYKREYNTAAAGRCCDARALGARGGGQSSLELGDARSGRTLEAEIDADLGATADCKRRRDQSQRNAMNYISASLRLIAAARSGSLVGHAACFGPESTRQLF
ncbi:PiggyBac transposable element-derived protein 4 [Eumeta japonica]|uniref:PiggyBac transposable element-derived protein 4 n=1 Tax=Eumeta variegata TaxID=151549 RepID=A0A4C1XDL2_EUMVA|nr:PiggyBac transposable element-derived protein 4 [Eumeta japonica]